jgi:HSP20 family protein
MNITKYKNPYNILLDDDENFLSPFNNMVKNFFGKDSSFFGKDSSCLVNVTETDKNYNLEFILPGYKKDEVSINIDNDILTVIANKEKNEENKDTNYIRKEYVSSSFSRTFSLPDNVSEKIKAEMNNGILNINIEKINKKEKKPKIIEIE